MYPQYTEDAQAAMQIANRLAREDDYAFARTQHLLLALATVEGYSRTLLADQGAAADRIQTEIQSLERSLDEAGEIRPVIKGAINEVRRLNHNRQDTGHLLLAILGLPQCTAAQILDRLRIDFVQVRDQLVRLLPVPTFPLSEAEKVFGDHPRIRELRKREEELEIKRDESIAAQDFCAARDSRDRRRAVVDLLEAELESLWKEQM